VAPLARPAQLSQTEHQSVPQGEFIIAPVRPIQFADDSSTLCSESVRRPAQVGTLLPTGLALRHAKMAQCSSMGRANVSLAAQQMPTVYLRLVAQALTATFLPMAMRASPALRTLLDFRPDLLAVGAQMLLATTMVASPDSCA